MKDSTGTTILSQLRRSADHGVGHVLSGVFPKEAMVLLCLLIVLGAVAGALVPGFLRVANILNLARIVSLTGVMAIGLTFVILLGDIDLSVGSTMSLSAVIGGQVLGLWGSIPGVIATLCAGMVLGFINGIGTVKGRIPAMIMTLATLIIYAGLAYVLVGGATVYTYDFPAYTWIGRGSIAGIPFPFVVFGVVFLVSVFVLHFTPFGRWLFYTGANRRASWYTGGNTNRVRIVAFVLSGLLASASGPMISGTLHKIWISQGAGYELTAITIVFLGGTTLWGGQGSLTGTLLAALIIGCLLNVLNLTGVSTYVQEVVKGCLLVGAVAAMSFRVRR